MMMDAVESASIIVQMRRILVRGLYATINPSGDRYDEV